MTPSDAARAIEEILAQLETATGQRVTGLEIYEYDVTQFNSPGRVHARGVSVSMQTYSIEYLPFKGNAA